MSGATASFHALPARVRARWRRDALAGGLAASLLALGAAAAVLMAVDLLVGLGPGARTMLRWLPPALALLPWTVAWRRARALADARRAALLLEEREPDLEHLLTTVLEADLSTPVGAALRRRAAERLAHVRVERAVPYTFGRGVPWAAGALLIASGFVVVAPGGPRTAWARWAHPTAHAARATSHAAATAGAADASAAGASAPSLTSLHITVAPPSYTGLPRREASPDALLSAFPGTRIEIRVAATGGTLVARRAGGSPLRVATPADPERTAEADLGTERAWQVSWLLEPDDRGVDLALQVVDGGADAAPSRERADPPPSDADPPPPDAGAAGAEAGVADRRVVPVAVLEDRPPEVVLELPAQDMVVASASGTVRVRARTTDDFGVADWDLHWIHSSGSGESFSFEEGRWVWDEVTARGDTLVAEIALDLAETGLEPGDVLHLRAEARDGNDVTGPGVGVSATRLLRVAEADALDEVTTLIGFPIEREREPLLSQRMIILLTEELLAQAEGLDEATFRERSNRIADEQDRLRERVEEAVFVRAAEAEEDPEARPVAPPDPDPDAAPVPEVPGHDHDGNPILAVNQDMMAAFNAMWEASRLLRQAEPRASLPPQHEALERLQAVREGERVFARGRVTRPPLDLESARGTGEVDEAAPAHRSRGEAAPDGTRWRDPIEAAAVELMSAASAEDPNTTAATDSPTAVAGPGGSGGDALALRLQDLAAAILAAPDGSVTAAAAVERAARMVASGRPSDARALLGEAASALLPGTAAGTAPPLSTPADGLEASYLASLERAVRDAPSPSDVRSRADAPASTPPASANAVAAGERRFVFATARYASGDWDSAPLVPSNLAHSLAQYTDLPVDEDGVVVDLSSPELMRYPFVFLTGHLPVRLDERESEGLRRYVEQGGFVFIDDHNHDIDGGFHRSVVSELARLFGPGALQRLPEDHELYRSFFVFEDGPPITGHELSGWGDGLIHRELSAITVDGRIGVLYSNKDYASEWSYHAENKRFLARDNTRFGVNVILYALTR